MEIGRKKKSIFSIIKITYILTLLGWILVAIPSPYFCYLVVFFFFSSMAFYFGRCYGSTIFPGRSCLFFISSYSNTCILCLDLSFSNITLPILKKTTCDSSCRRHNIWIKKFTCNILCQTDISSHHSIQFKRSRKLHYMTVIIFGTNLNVFYVL